MGMPTGHMCGNEEKPIGHTDDHRAYEAQYETVRAVNAHRARKRQLGMPTGHIMAG